MNQKKGGKIQLFSKAHLFQQSIGVTFFHVLNFFVSRPSEGVITFFFSCNFHFTESKLNKQILKSFCTKPSFCASTPHHTASTFQYCTLSIQQIKTTHLISTPYPTILQLSMRKYIMHSLSI